MLTAQEEEKIKKVQRPFQPRTRFSWGNAATFGSENGPKKVTFQANGSNNGGKEANCWGPGSNQPTFELGTTRSGHNDSISMETLQQVLDRNRLLTPTCPFMGPREKICNWQQQGADNVLLSAIRRGVKAPLHSIPDPKNPRHIPTSAGLEETIGEY